MDWRDKIRKGDVLKSPSGVLRVARAVSRKKGKLNVTFSILRCSWTGRCYTVYTRTDLKKWAPTGMNYPLRTKLDKQIAKALEDGPAKMGKKYTLSCCDVRGIT